MSPAPTRADMRAAPVLPVIGLWQPYASLVAIGAKPWETRHFPPPRRMVGVRVAIQATLRKPTRDEVEYAPSSVAAALGGPGWERRVPYGAVVCTAILSHALQVRQMHDNRDVRLANGQVISDDGFGDYGIFRWCWALKDIVQPSAPIPLKGRQEVGWPWSPDADQRAALDHVAAHLASDGQAQADMLGEMDHADPG